MTTSTISKGSFRLLFFLNRSKVRPNGTSPILLRITINGRQLAMSIQRNVRPKEWDAASGLVRGRSDEAQVINRYMEVLRIRAYDRYNELLLYNEDVTPAMLKDAILSINSSRSKSLISVWEEHNLELKQLIGRETSYANWQKNNTCLNYMKEFLRINGHAEDFSLKQLDRHLITRFEHFLKIQKNCSANTATKYMQNLKKIVRRACQNGWIKRDPFAGIRLSIKDADRPYLSAEELQSIAEKHILPNRLRQVRDMFLFSCYTGLAYIDIYHLTHADLERDPDGLTWIRTQRIKTKVRSNIPLLEIPARIIERYANQENSLPTDKVLPVLSNQKMNAYLKEIGDICGITKRLTFHVARHTFATTVTLMNGVPIESVSRMLGHTNIKTTQHYARIVDTKVGEDMRKLAVRMGCGLG